ncbi:DUF3618 domain-containing protein [Micromonospora echinofusca]|uniref:DUF3618 domain-containing protein n=1 Tax=Micromonospora echinofusca TaxID=47858 RepID=A0ABS3VXW6_MICEH|nr:DUF3618 domain-containing protein [Micromonospora echinofusca]MBO4209348.1 DUF3618 domain-containing protein [Micromonospora echinofusca]
MTGNGNRNVDPETLRAEIRRTRIELGETVEALAAKADVKARLKDSADQAKERMREQAAQTRDRVREQAVRLRGQAAAVRAAGPRSGTTVRRGPLPVAVLLAGAVAVVVVLVVRGRRSR